MNQFPIPQNEHPTTDLRFLLRDGRYILQQKIVIYLENEEWRDVPRVEDASN